MNGQKPIYQPKAATPKQVAFLQSLLRRKQVPVEVSELIDPLKELHGDYWTDYLSAAFASQQIDRLTRSPDLPVAGGQGVTDPGMYRTTDGTIFKVQKSKDSGRLYAKKLTPISGSRLSETDDRVRWDFQYDKGAVYHLTADQRMTLDEAKAFGIQYGICCVCGAFLKDATSVSLGIGPTCRKSV